MNASSESGLWATVIFIQRTESTSVKVASSLLTHPLHAGSVPFRRAAVMRLAKVLVLVVVSGATALAQIHDLSKIPTISPVPNDFVGNWDWTTPRQSCGSSRDSYGQVVTFEGTADGRVVCQWPIDRLEKVLNGRGRAWRTFTLNGADDAISPRWTCVAAGLGTVLTDGYARGFYKNADAVM